MYAAEHAHSRSLPQKIMLSGGYPRPWNLWDYVWISSFVLAAAFFVVGLMFANKDD